MLLLLLPQGSEQPALDANACLADAVYRLGFQGYSDLSGADSWVTPSELFGFADDAAKRLSYQAGVFVTADNSVTISGGLAAYSLPAKHIFTVAAWLGAAPLRITPVRDLWALDGAWPETTGPAARCSFDAGSIGTVTLYPIPSVGGALLQVCQVMPDEITAGATVVALPTCMQSYFTYAMLAGARGKESEAAMPEMAEHFRQMAGLYEAVAAHLWGGA